MAWSVHKIKYEMAERGWTLTKAAKQMDLSVGHVSDVISLRTPSARVQDFIAEIVGESRETIFGEAA